MSNESLTEQHELAARGVGRDNADERSVSVYFNRRPTDNELRWLHDHLRKGIQHRYRIGAHGCQDCEYDPMVVYD